MKIVFRKDVICAAVAPLMSGVSTKMTLAATEGILIEASLPNLCIMTTYDIEKGGISRPYNIFNEFYKNVNIQIKGGILEKECKELFIK